MGNRSHMLFHHCKIWQLAKLWVAQGVIFLSQVLANSSIKTFQALKDSYNVPNHMFFRYLQLHHALHSQFRDSIPSLELVYLVDVVTGQDPKKRIALFYNHLMLPAATAQARQLKSLWESDLGDVTDEDWEEVLASCKLVSPKLSDCFTHLYIFHRPYLTPIWLSKYRPEHSPACPKCGDPGGTFYHLIWSCLSL